MLLNNLTLFWEFFKVGSFTLGGGAAMIPQIQEIAVNEKKWLTEEEMLDCIALGQSLPGVIAINTATYIGYRKGGITGAVSATVGVILPAFIAIVVMMALLGFIGDNKIINGAFTGVKAAVCGLIFMTAVKMFRQFAKDRSLMVFSAAVSLAALILVAFAGINAAFVILGGIFIGIIYSSVRRVK